MFITATSQQTDLDKVAKNYDYINKEQINNIKISKLESDLHPSKLSTANNFQPRSNAPCFSSRQLDTGASILSILGEKIGIPRAVFTTFFPSLPGIGTIVVWIINQSQILLSLQQHLWIDNYCFISNALDRSNPWNGTFQLSFYRISTIRRIK